MVTTPLFAEFNPQTCTRVCTQLQSTTTFYILIKISIVQCETWARIRLSLCFYAHGKKYNPRTWTFVVCRVDHYHKYEVLARIKAIFVQSAITHMGRAIINNHDVLLPRCWRRLVGLYYCSTVFKIGGSLNIDKLSRVLSEFDYLISDSTNCPIIRKLRR